MNFFKIKKNKIPFGKPLVDFKEINSVTKVLKSGIYAHGPISNLFEKKFCSFTGAKFSSTVSSEVSSTSPKEGSSLFILYNFTFDYIF